MRALLCSILGWGLIWPTGALAAGPGLAWRATRVAPTSDADIDPAVVRADGTASPPDANDPIDAASAAWTRGDWSTVRRLLEPVADDPKALLAAHVRTRVLLLLADATLSDESLDLAERRRLAASYLGRQMDADSSWRMPPDIYTKALFDLYVDVSGERSRDEIDRCMADVMACRSDVKNEQQQTKKLEAKHAQLEADYAKQEVEVRDRVARSRVFAAIPFGVGHFYNGDKAIGATFLSAELAFGITGMTLLLYRVVGDGCRRRRAFQSGSLVCASDDLDSIKRRRNAEEVMAWFFYGSLALDIVLAQIRFKPFETAQVRRVPRAKLEAGAEGVPPPRRRGRPAKNKPRASVRPTAGGSRHGAHLGVSIRF